METSGGVNILMIDSSNAVAKATKPVTRAGMITSRINIMPPVVVNRELIPMTTQSIDRAG